MIETEEELNWTCESCIQHGRSLTASTFGIYHDGCDLVEPQVDSLIQEDVAVITSGPVIFTLITEGTSCGNDLLVDNYG